jgi:hypothetical protein
VKLADGRRVVANDRGFESVYERSGAFAEPRRLLGIIELVVNLEIDALLGALNLVSPMQHFDDLLRAKRDQHAHDDDPDLAGELAPAMQRFGQVEMHRSTPQNGNGVC